MTDDKDRIRLSRRSLVVGMASFSLSSSLAQALPIDADTRMPGLVLREQDPQNLESSFASLDSLITANDKFYIRSHFAVPTLEAKSWNLKVEGAVSNPLQITFDNLQQLPAETKAVTLECAGNGRVYLVPKVDGLQWQLGAVGTAEWTGVSLNSLLERAGVDPAAVDVVLEGADTGEPTKPSKPAKPISFSRSISLDKARNGGVLLAYKMNGQPLPPAHGYPVRAIVPGWYGVASVKWLSRIVVLKCPYQGYFQTVDYAYWQHRDGFATRVPVTEIQVKSQIARPAVGEVITPGTNYRVFGAAWSGNSPISKVQISTDGGKSYAPAKLLGQPANDIWRLWEFQWSVPAKSSMYTLVAKATDGSGNTQPLGRDKDRETYMINHVLPVDVQVR